jgi:fructokinase
MADSKPLLAGVELGGTKCICILASGPDDIREQQRVDTGSPDKTLDAIDVILSRWQTEHGFTALGLASFGPLDLDERSPGYGRIVATPKRGWSGTDILSRVRHFAVPIGFDTDVNAAAIAEGRWGAARGLRSYAYVTVGTGVGVGAIIEGRAVRGLGHCEAGHLRVPRLAGEDWPGNCPYHGDCVEGLAAGPAIQARTGLPASDLPPDHPAWGEVVHTLAALFHNLVFTTAPERILLGGGVGGGQPHLIPRIRQALVKSLGGYAIAPAIAARIDDFVQTPALGAAAGPLGAIALALASQQH